MQYTRCSYNTTAYNWSTRHGFPTVEQYKILGHSINFQFNNIKHIYRIYQNICYVFMRSEVKMFLPIWKWGKAGQLLFY